MRPLITNVMAMSVDGRIAVQRHETDTLRQQRTSSSEIDSKHVRSLLSEADAVIIGAETARGMDPSWFERNRHGRYPVWMAYTTKGVGPTSGFWAHDQVPRVLVCPKELISEKAPEDSAELLPYDGEGSATGVALEYLQRHSLRHVLLFGGGQINRLFYNAGLVDKLIVTVCPRLDSLTESQDFIAKGLDRSVNLKLLGLRSADGHVFLEYQVEAGQ